MKLLWKLKWTLWMAPLHQFYLLSRKVKKISRSYVLGFHAERRGMHSLSFSFWLGFSVQDVMWSQLTAKQFHFSERWEHRGRTIGVARYQVRCIKYPTEHRLLHLLCAIPAKVKQDHVETLKYTDPLSPRVYPEETEPYTSDSHVSPPQHARAWGFKVKHGVIVRSSHFLKEYRSVLSC